MKAQEYLVIDRGDNMMNIRVLNGCVIAVQPDTHDAATLVWLDDAFICPFDRTEYLYLLAR